MKKLFFFPYCIVVFVLGFKSVKGWAQVSSPTDYFRSAKPGLWDAPDTWESSSDGLNNWVPAALVPTSEANTITIRVGHNVSITNNVTVDQVVVTGGGILELATGSSFSLTVNNGSGSDIIVQNGGIFKHTGASLPTFGKAATLEIQRGGILEAANGAPDGYANTASPISSNLIWNDGAVFNWNTPFNPAEGVTYFPPTSAVPIFRFSQPVTIGGSANTVINGLLEANANVSFQGSGLKIFRNGILGTGKVGVTAVNGGQFVISGPSATLGGSGILELNANGLLISNSCTLTLTSNKTINNYPGSTGGSITEAGTLILEKFIINGNSKIKIDGTVKTTNIYGLTGGANTSFATASGFTVNTLSASSAIEYNGLEKQVITPLSYNNLIIQETVLKLLL